MRIAIVTDAWNPQVNGVVRTLERLANEATLLGDEISFVTPAKFKTIPLPFYPEISLSLTSRKAVADAIQSINADALHISTEGPLGHLARSWAVKNNIPFTSCYHTHYPLYISARFPVPEHWTYAYLRWFHSAAQATMVATEDLKKTLIQNGFKNLMIWSRGVDGQLFKPRPNKRLYGEGPVFLCVARLAVEKNLDAFLSLDLPGKKVMVGDGPDRTRLQKQYKDVIFTGALFGEDLAEAYAAADSFVFPSVSETFGLVLLEALASGLPIAAFPASGLLAEIQSAGLGVLDHDLKKAAMASLAIPREACRGYALGFSHQETTRQFIGNIRNALNVPYPPIAA
jgi:glycosyltransferase involved in cell wall biosynthesis